MTIPLLIIGLLLCLAVWAIFRISRRAEKHWRDEDWIKSRAEAAERKRKRKAEAEERDRQLKIRAEEERRRKAQAEEQERIRKADAERQRQWEGAESPSEPAAFQSGRQANTNKLRTYFVILNGKQQGPYTLHQIRSLWDDGRLTLETHYRTSEDELWQPLSGLVSDIESPQIYNPARAPERSRSGVTVADPTHPLPPKPQQKSSGLGKAFGMGCLAIICLFALFAIIGAISCGGGGSSSDRNRSREAYDYAKDFIRRQYPGAKEFGSYRESIVTQDNNIYDVAITVDGLSPFGGPIRKTVGVEMEYTGDTWKLIRIDQQ
jgi:hypothetical protein